MLNADVMNGKSEKSVVEGLPRESLFHRGRKAAGFTLIELLVVIAIIAILMGISFTAFQRAVERARITRARSEVELLQQAWLAYWNTYYDPSDDDFRWPSVMQMTPAAVAILAGVDTDANPHGIAFMEFDNVHLENGFVDPWGENLYQIVFLDDDEIASETVFQTRIFLGNAARDRY